MIRWAKYQVIPFVDGGRNWLQCDCWGLIRLIFKEERNIELPSYGDTGATELMKIARLMASDSNGPKWASICAPTIYDVCLMSDIGKRRVVHVGLVINETSLIHTEQGTGVLCQKLSDPSIKQRIQGFRRYQENA